MDLGVIQGEFRALTKKSSCHANICFSSAAYAGTRAPWKPSKLPAKLALPLIIAGRLDETDEPYFRTYVEPYLEPGKIDFIGEVEYSKKLTLFGGAIAVLYPIAFEEPFGLVMAEALASGTPVLALDRGAVREVLSDGQNSG